MLAPVIETQRLKLRPHRKEDFSELCKMWSDAEVIRFIGGVPSTEQQSWSRLLGYSGHWDFMGYGYWALEEKSSGSYAGGMGFGHHKRDVDPQLKGLPELGWALTPTMQGKGYAHEALNAIIDWGRRNLSSPEVFCMIHPEHARSIQLAEKLGFHKVLQSSDSVFFLLKI